MSRRSVNHWQKRLIRQHRSSAKTLANLSRNPRHDSNQGFALPMALGMGLIMLLVGVTMILRSQDDQVTASAQKATGRGLSAAETGITRYQSLINNNRVIATYNACQNWDTSSPSTGACNDTGSTPITWKNASSIPGLITCSSSTGPNIISQEATRAWQDVDSGDPSKGQYRLFDYTYNPAPGTAPGSGTLIVEGRVSYAGSGSTATQGAGTATSRLQVNIPVQRATSDPFPGMWIANSVNTGTIQANIMASCNGTVSADFAPGYQLTRSNLPMPAMPARSTTYLTTSGSTATISNPSTFQRINDPTEMTLPRATDRPSRTSTGETIYEYSVSQITGDLDITPGYKVAIYLDGNIDLQGGQKAIRHQCETIANRDPSNGNLPGWSSSCSPTDARIYGLSQNGQLKLGGNASICDIFFHAPTYDVSLNGGGQAQGCGGGANNNGIYWVRSWSGGGQGNHVSLYQTNASWNSLPFSVLPPQIAPVASWQRNEVQ